MHMITKAGKGVEVEGLEGLGFQMEVKGQLVWEKSMMNLLRWGGLECWWCKEPW